MRSFGQRTLSKRWGRYWRMRVHTGTPSPQFDNCTAASHAVRSLSLFPNLPVAISRGSALAQRVMQATTLPLQEQ